MAKGPAEESQNIEELARYNYGFPVVMLQLLRL
jgi:hypothetical protein